MKVSFNGIGEKLVTFINEGAAADQMVKVSAAGTVSPCAEGEKFAGMAVFAEGGYASVRLGGFVTASYTGTEPGFGYVALVADGNGGVKTGEGGGSYLVVDKDTVKGTLTFCL